MAEPETQCCNTVLKLPVEVYDAKIRKQEKREHQKELILYLWATTIRIVEL
jgi:hypothetical protein